MPTRGPTLYIGAALLCFATLWVRFLIGQYVELQRPLTILFLVPVLLTAYYGGGKLGSFTTILSAILMSIFITGHRSVATEVTYLGLFVVVGLLISLVCDRLQKSQVALQVSLDQLELAASAAQLGILDHDMRSNTMHINARLRELVGISADDDQDFVKWLNHVHTDDRDRVACDLQRRQKPGYARDYALRHRLIRMKDQVTWVDVWGRTLFAEVNGKPTAVRTVLVYKDVTEDVLREKAIAETQRFEALGRLTSGIAHNFNNILTIISGNLQLAKFQVPSLSNYIDEALSAADMGERLVKRLVRVAQKAELSISRIHVNDLVQSLVRTSSRTLGSTVSIELLLKAEPDTIEVDLEHFPI